MNPLLLLTTVGSAGLSLAVWQQTAISRVHENVARLGRDLVTVRQTLEADHDKFLQARHQIDLQRENLREVRRTQSERSAQIESEYTPEKEGWWPENRPYFYLPKSSLQFVTFGKCVLPMAEVNALLTKRMKAEMPGVTSVELTPRAEKEFEYEFRLFDQNVLNRDAAALLGMSEAERTAVQDLYAGFFREVRKIEAAHAIRVNPPETVANGKIVARIPVISDEVRPLLSGLNQQIEQLLGASRAGILAGFAEDYAAEHLDRLGDEPREFIQTGQSLIVGVGHSQLWQPRSLKGESDIGYGGFPAPLDYTHIFGPGAPCELK